MTGITHTVGVNVIDGTIRVDLPNDDDTAAWDDLAEPEGGVFNGTTIEPWGVDEESMDRGGEYEWLHRESRALACEERDVAYTARAREGRDCLCPYPNPDCMHPTCPRVEP